MSGMTLAGVLDIALWVAAAGHACVLVAGAQAPARLGWREDTAKLQPFTRKVFWVYYVFVGMTVLAFGVLTAVLHDDMLRGDRGAVCLAGFIALWWTFRILVDVFVFRHAEWPPGRRFLVGHVLLDAAFVGMAATYALVVVRYIAI